MTMRKRIVSRRDEGCEWMRERDKADGELLDRSNDGSMGRWVDELVGVLGSGIAEEGNRAVSARRNNGIVRAAIRQQGSAQVGQIV